MSAGHWVAKCEHGRTISFTHECPDCAGQKIKELQIENLKQREALYAIKGLVHSFKAPPDDDLGKLTWNLLTILSSIHDTTNRALEGQLNI